MVFTVIYNPNQTVREARDEYYRRNGIAADGGAREWIGRADFGPITLYVPNFKARVAALQRHDLHHILLDADTSMKGEAKVGGFEVGAGCGKFWVAWALEPQAVAYGLILNPRETWKSFLLGRKSKSLYLESFWTEWLDKTVGQLREEILAKKIAEATVAEITQFALWSIAGWFGLLISIAFMLVPWIIGIYLFRKFLI
jgi:hypothetical protein